MKKIFKKRGCPSDYDFFNSTTGHNKITQSLLKKYEEPIVHQLLNIFFEANLAKKYTIETENNWKYSVYQKQSQGKSNIEYH